MNFDIDKIITQLEAKETLLIFLRDNFPDVLEAWKNKSKSGGLSAHQHRRNIDDAITQRSNLNDHRDTINE